MRYWLAVAAFSWTGYDLWYRLAYLGAIVSYGVVIYKSFGVPRTEKSYLQRAPVSYTHLTLPTID